MPDRRISLDRTKYYGSILLGMLAALACPAKDEAKDRRFGVMTHFSQDWEISLVDELGRGPVRFVRDEIPWADIEEKKGKFVFSARHDDYMAALGRHDISPLIIFAFGNEHYDGGMTPYSERGLQGYVRYCEAVLAHYGTQIQEVEIWNEYNGAFCQGPALKSRASHYLKMLKAAYTRIKAIRPDMTVCGGATEGAPLPYWEKLLADGAAKYLDVVSVHPYRFEQPPEGLEEEIEALRALIRKYNDGKEKPIWVSEIGWGAVANEQMGTLSADESIQARFLVRAYALLLSAGVERVYWYLLQDYQQFQMGLLKRDDKSTPRPAYFALKAMMEQLKNATFTTREPTDDDVYSLVFTKPSGEKIRIIWETDGAHRVLKTQGQAFDLIGNPIDTAKGIALSDEPIYIRDEVFESIARRQKPSSLIANSFRDFAPEQGSKGWFYGYSPKGEFIPMEKFVNTEANAQWEGVGSFLLISATEQHPTLLEGEVVPAIRRWVSPVDGEIMIKAEFHCGSEGDGVGVSVAVDNKRLFREVIGGKHGLSKTFTTICSVKKGSTLDFAVDPGPGTNINFDGTKLQVRLRHVQ